MDPIDQINQPAIPSWAFGLTLLIGVLAILVFRKIQERRSEEDETTKPGIKTKKV